MKYRRHCAGRAARSLKNRCRFEPQPIFGVPVFDGEEGAGRITAALIPGVGKPDLTNPLLVEGESVPTLVGVGIGVALPPAIKTLLSAPTSRAAGGLGLGPGVGVVKATGGGVGVAAGAGVVVGVGATATILGLDFMPAAGFTSGSLLSAPVRRQSAARRCTR